MSVNWVLVAISIIFGIAYMIAKYFIYDRELYSDIMLEGIQFLLISIDTVKDMAFIYIILYYLLYKI